MFYATCAVAVYALAGFLVAPPIVRSQAEQTSAEPAELFLWRVEGEGGQLHLLGSVAVPNTSTLRFAPEVQRAFDEADLLVLPTNAAELGTAASLHEMIAHSRRRSGEVLYDLLPPEVAQRLRGAAESMGAPGRAIGPTTAPWFASVQVRGWALERVGYVDEFEFELYFATLAYARKEVRAFETLGESFARLDMLPLGDQSDLLAEALLGFEDASRTVPSVEAAWHAGDSKALEKAMEAALVSAPALRERGLLRQRADNERIAGVLLELLEEGRRPFVVLPSHHLVGASGVLLRLGERGFNVTQERTATGEPRW